MECLSKINVSGCQNLPKIDKKSMKNPFKIGAQFFIHFGGQHGSQNPNIAPTLANITLIWAQHGPNLAQLGPTWAQLGPNLAQLGPTWAQLGPTWALRPLNLEPRPPKLEPRLHSKMLHASKMPPRCPKMPPRAPKSLNLNDFWSIFGRFLIDFWWIFG